MISDDTNVESAIQTHSLQTRLRNWVLATGYRFWFQQLSSAQSLKLPLNPCFAPFVGMYVPYR
jgi:hypothetical protein